MKRHSPLSLLTFLLLALTGLLPVKAERFLPLPSSPDSIIVSLLTCAPGAEIYELEGHSALRLRYDGYDITANWGVFDFQAPNFVYRFVKGETDYSIGVCPTIYFVDAYTAQGRRVTEQVLDISDSAAAEVVSQIETNLQPANRIYRYNFVLDNCATRIIDIINRAIAPDSISFCEPDSTLARLERTSFRNVMRQYHRNYPWYQFGIDLALGHNLDRSVNTRATAFAPQTLMHLMDHAVIAPAGVPLVSHTDILSPGPAQGIAMPPTPWYLTPCFFSWLLLALSAFIALRAIRARRTPALYTALSFTAYAIAGCIIFFLVFISVHYAASPNSQLLWLNPLAFVVPLLIAWPRCSRLLAAYFIINLAAIVATVICWFATPQWIDPAFPPLLLNSALLSLTYLTTNKRQHA